METRRMVVQANQAIHQNENGHGPEVYGILAEGWRHTRIIKARTRGGRLEGKILATGYWKTLVSIHIGETII